MKNIIVVEAVSTGYNYVEDIIRRGYNPVVLEAKMESAPEVAEVREASYLGFYHQPEIIKEAETYEETLEIVKRFDPVLIVAGSETGVVLCTRLSDDLQLPGNSAKYLDAMTKKDAMHLALKAAGIRYIRGEKVHSTEEALAFCRRNGLSTAVVKPLQSAGSQGLFLCDNTDQVEAAVRKLLNTLDFFGKPIEEVLVQERIVGTEYIVNTISSEGVHRLNSVLRYKKVKTDEGGYIYDYIEFVKKLEPGHSKLIEYAFQVADAIHFQNGIIHGEYMIDDKGPVLIEVNCRPMGCTMPAEFIDLVYGQHETDTTLDSLLNPKKFLKDLGKPYRPHRKAYLKLIMIPKDMEAEDHPIWELARHLRSTYKIVANTSSVSIVYSKTRDLESNGGIVFLVHDDERVVDADLSLLRRIEKKFFELLINDGMSRKWFEDSSVPPTDYKTLMEECGCSGSILIAADDQKDVDGARCVTPETLKDARKGFDYVIIDYRRAIIEASETNLLKLMFDTMDLVREGGKVIIPESTYRYKSYGREGAEVLMAVKGLTLEAYSPGSIRKLVGTNEPL